MMSSCGSRLATILIGAVLTSGCGGDAHTNRQLRVCADPNNLPFSNAKEEGFENRIARILADELNAELTYTWWAQRRGFIRNTLRAGECDLVMGMPTSMELALPTRPYYRSTYVFLYRADAEIKPVSFDDEALRGLRIGVHLIGDDYTNAPPAHALASRGLVNNLVGFSVYGDYSQPNPPARLVEAVAAGEIDVAVVWGPLAGYFGPRAPVPLEMAPVRPQIDLPYVPFVYDISMGVRRTDTLFRAEIEEALNRRRDEVNRVLREYGVVRIDL